MLRLPTWSIRNANWFSEFKFTHYYPHGQTTCISFLKKAWKWVHKDHTTSRTHMTKVKRYNTPIFSNQCISQINFETLHSQWILKQLVENSPLSSKQRWWLKLSESSQPWITCQFRKEWLPLQHPRKGTMVTHYTVVPWNERGIEPHSFQPKERDSGSPLPVVLPAECM